MSKQGRNIKEGKEETKEVKEGETFLEAAGFEDEEETEWESSLMRQQQTARLFVGL